MYRYITPSHVAFRITTYTCMRTCSIPGKHPLPDKHPGEQFAVVNENTTV